MSTPVVPQRPSRSQNPEPATAAVTSPTLSVPQVPPRPTRSVDRSISRERESYARSPLNTPGFAFKAPSRKEHGMSPSDFGSKVERPPSVASLPLVGEEGLEYASLDQLPSQVTLQESKDAAQPNQTINVAQDLPLHAPRAAAPTSAAQQRIANVTRTDSSRAASAGIGKASTDYAEFEKAAVRPPSASSNHMRTPSASGRRPSSSRPLSAQDSDHDHGIPEIGLRVGLNPAAGDVQAPSANSSRPVTSDGKRRSAHLFHGPPGSYGLHGHGVGPHDSFERAWYQKHPEEAAKEEHSLHGHALTGERSEFALSSEQLNRLVHGSSRTGEGIDRSSMGTPDENLVYAANDARAAPTEPSAEVLRARMASTHETHKASPLRRASTQDDSELDSTSEPYPRGTTPIFASDETARHPNDFRAAAISPAQSKHAHDEDYVSGSESDAPYRTKSRNRSRPSSRPSSVHDHHGLSKWVSHDHFEGTGTPLESVEEYEPLFGEEEKEEPKRPLTAADKLKRPDLDRRFPSRDIWEDTPESLEYTAEVDEPDLERPAPRSAAAAFEPPEVEQARKGEVMESERRLVGNAFQPGVTKAKPKFNAGIQQEVNERPAMRHRFPSQDIWEDSPDSLQHTAEIGDEPKDLPQPTAVAQGMSQVDSSLTAPPAKPSIPARPTRTKEAAGVASASTAAAAGAALVDRKAPVVPDRPKPSVPAKTKVATNDQEPIPGSVTVDTPITATKSKPAVVPKSEAASGKFASIRSGFLGDLESRLKLGPHAPPKPAASTEDREEVEEKAPLMDARKGRAKGPARRKPATETTSDAGLSASAGKFSISTPQSIWSIADRGSQHIQMHEKSESAIGKLQAVVDAPMHAEGALAHVPDPAQDARAQFEEVATKADLAAHDAQAIGHPGDMPEPSVRDETHVSIPPISPSKDVGQGAPLTTTESRHLSEPEGTRQSTDDAHPSIEKALDNPVSPDASAGAPMQAIVDEES